MMQIDLIIGLDRLRIVIVFLCCLPCILTETCEDCAYSVYESLDVDNKSVYPFKKRQYYWFQQEKKYKSPNLLSSIIEPSDKVTFLHSMHDCILCNANCMVKALFSPEHLS